MCSRIAKKRGALKRRSVVGSPGHAKRANKSQLAPSKAVTPLEFFINLKEAFPTFSIDEDAFVTLCLGVKEAPALQVAQENPEGHEGNPPVEPVKQRIAVEQSVESLLPLRFLRCGFCCNFCDLCYPFPQGSQQRQDCGPPPTADID